MRKERKKNKIQIALIGAQGQMGKAIASLKDLNFEITYAFTRQNPAHPVSVDLFIDFSSDKALEENLQTALLAKKPIVIGTTGLLNFDLIKEASQSIPIFYSPNFSLGIHLMQKAALYYAQALQHLTSVQLTETHHVRKKDAPSGSALMLAQSIEKTMGKKVPIQSIRTGEIRGEHTLSFHTDEECLTLSHVAQNRSAFARGAIAAAHFLVEQGPGLFGMDNLLSSQPEEKATSLV